MPSVSEINVQLHMARSNVWNLEQELEKAKAAEAEGSNSAAVTDFIQKRNAAAAARPNPLFRPAA